MCDRSSRLFTQNFLPPSPHFSLPYPFDFPGPSLPIQRASLAVRPGPVGSPPVGPLGWDPATRPARPAQLLFVLKG